MGGKANPTEQARHSKWINHKWGWDSKEMCRDIISDDSLLHFVPKHWILPIAAGYLPPKYRDNLAGGRLDLIDLKRAFDLSMLRMHGDESQLRD